MTKLIDETYTTIDTVPRDGSGVYVAHEDVGASTMRWNEDAENGLFPGVKGMWETPGQQMTWTEHDGNGPSHWKPVNKETLN